MKVLIDLVRETFHNVYVHYVYTLNILQHCQAVFLITGEKWSLKKQPILLAQLNTMKV